jgi:HSP20 family protein
MITLFKRDPFFTNFLDSVFETETTDLWKGFVNTNKSVDGDGVTLEFVVPGLSKEDISVYVEDNKLKVSYTAEITKSKYVEPFERTYTLGEDLDDKKISAKVENGVLTLTVPKSKKKNSQREISIS